MPAKKEKETAAEEHKYEEETRVYRGRSWTRRKGGRGREERIREI